MQPTIRKAIPSDLNFIRASWARSYWQTHARRHIPFPEYQVGQNKRMARILSGATTLVAYFPEVPDEVLGWVCREGSVLHYCYVKSAYRRNGIGSGLAGSMLKSYTHASDSTGGRFLDSLGLNFNPYLLEEL